MPGGAADDPLGVLDRMTAILEAFDQDDHGLGISELALRAGLPKSTVSRLVTTLVRQHYLERDGNRIHLGLRVFELGQLAGQPRELRAVAPPVLAELRERTGATVYVAIRDGCEMVCIAAIRGRSAPSPVVRTGGRLPVHATALGKAVLAHAPKSDVDAVVDRGLRAWTGRTIVDPDVLRGQLDDIRRGAFALADGEFADGVACAATAVFAPSAGIAGAVAVSRCATGAGGAAFDVDALAPVLRDAAQRITRRLAASSSRPPCRR